MGFSVTATASLLLMISVLALSNSLPEPSGSDEQYYLVQNVAQVVLVSSIPSKDVVRCARILVPGLSRLDLRSFFNSHRITLVPSEEIGEVSYKKIQICLLKDTSCGLCQCQSDTWKNLQNGTWISSVISPYEDRHIDVKFVNNLYGSVTVRVKSEFHMWRPLCLIIGIVLLLLAPILSSWLPFYYSSSMAIGVCLVVIILLKQLLPTGRKSALYSTICGLALGAGSYLLNPISMFVNSILINFGISEEMHNPVLVFFLVGVVLAGAGLGYWFVQNYVVSPNGVNAGVAQYMIWALWVLAVTFIFQSTLDTPLAIVLLALLASLLGIHFAVTSLKGRGFGQDLEFPYIGEGRPHLWNGKGMNKNKRAEFLSRHGTQIPKGSFWRNPTYSPAQFNTPVNLKRSSWGNPTSSPAWSNSPLKGVVMPPSPRTASSSEDYYSTFHTTPNKKRYSKEEWMHFTDESTREALVDMMASPEFTDWIIKNADSIQLRPEGSSDESVGSGSYSTDENAA